MVVGREKASVIDVESVRLGEISGYRPACGPTAAYGFEAEAK
jgi:hypothetical protein